MILKTNTKLSAVSPSCNPASLEVENRRSVGQGQLGHKSLPDPISTNKKAECGGACLSSWIHGEHKWEDHSPDQLGYKNKTLKNSLKMKGCTTDEWIKKMWYL
jgi:hypothetical protein